MGLLIKMAESRAIKKIAKHLPKALVSGYGGTELFTPGQVGAAMEKTGCNSDYIDHAYAMFCSKDDFDSISDGDYDLLHKEVGDFCFGGNESFSFSDAVSFSEGGGFSGGDAGGGD